MFGCILDCFVTAWNLMRNRLNCCNYCKSSCHELASEFLATNARDPPHWTLNSCFGASHSVRVHFGLFYYCTKLVAKRVELVQKFVSRSHVRIFCNKSTLSTSYFGAFHSVWVHLGPFRYCMKLGAKWVELVQLMHKFLPWSRIRIFRNEYTRSTPLDPKLMFWCVS